MIKSKTKGVLFATGILLIGIICGMLLGGMLNRKQGKHCGPFDYPRHRSDAMLQHFNKDLGLTAEQREQMKVILAEQKKAMNGLMREVRPKIDAQMEIFKAQTRAILTEPQRKKFDVIGARNEARQKKFKHRLENGEETRP